MEALGKDILGIRYQYVQRSWEGHELAVLKKQTEGPDQDGRVEDPELISSQGHTKTTTTY